MKISAISNANLQSRSVSFGDGYMPASFTEVEAMEKMNKKGYIIQGINTKDAFSRLYTDVDCVLNEKLQEPGSIRKADYDAWSDDTSIKFCVFPWDIKKEAFVETMTKFWNLNKNKLNENLSNAIEDYLVNVEGLKKPKWYQVFSSKFQEYMIKSGTLKQVTEIFLKTGKHRLS